MEWNGMGMPEMMQMKGLSVCVWLARRVKLVVS
jgi:hypothetical protein